MKKKSKIILLSSSILFIFCIIFFIHISFKFINNTFILLTTFFIIFTLVAVFFVLIRYSIKLLEKIEFEKLNYKNLSTLYDSLRAFKHDYANMIQALGGYIMLNDMNGLKTFYKDLNCEFDQINNISNLSPEVINNPCIYRTLCNKFYLAHNKNINIEFNIFSDLNKLNMKDFDLNRILGILLDNSIEAAICSNNKIIKLSILDIYNKKIIKIENTYQDKSIDLNKIFEKSYSTKKNNTGIGLWEINQILKKYKNLNLKTFIENELFVQELNICATT